MVIKIKIFLTIIFFTSIFFVSDTVHAQDSEILGQLGAFAGERGAQFGEARDPRSVVAKAINSMLGLLALLLVVYLIYGGAVILMSRGNEENVKKGQNIIKNAIIGLIIILFAYGIARLVVWILLKDEKGAPQACIEHSSEVTTDIMGPNINQPQLPYCDEVDY